MEDLLNTTITKIHKMVSITVEREKKPILLPSGELLYRIEIFVIDTIGSNPGINLTELAKQLCVTKGAVSQKVRVLEKKQFIRRYMKNSNRKEVMFQLTEKGMKAYQGHKAFHKQKSENIAQSIGKINENEIKILNKYLDFFIKEFET